MTSGKVSHFRCISGYLNEYFKYIRKFTAYIPNILKTKCNIQLMRVAKIFLFRHLILCMKLVITQLANSKARKWQYIKMKNWQRLFFFSPLKYRKISFRCGGRIIFLPISFKRNNFRLVTAVRKWQKADLMWLFFSYGNIDYFIKYYYSKSPPKRMLWLIQLMLKVCSNVLNSWLLHIFK